MSIMQLNIKDIQREKKLSQAVHKVNENYYKCDNPREALAWLRMGLGSEVKEVNGEWTYWNKENYLFRGHSSADWKLSTTMERTETPEEDQLTTKLFTDILENPIHTFFKKVSIQSGALYNPKLGACIAQHYGMATRLLDWTTQAEISLFFALNDQKSFEYGKIFLIKTKSIINKGLRIVVPPPFATRVFHQRGVFLDNDITNNWQSLDKDLICIEFKHKNIVDQEVTGVLDKYVFDDEFIYPENNWFDSLAQYCRKRIKSRDFNKDYNIELESKLFKEQYPLVKEIEYFSANLNNDDYLHIIGKMLDSLTREFKDGKSVPLNGVLDLFVTQNPIFVKWYYMYLKQRRNGS